MCIWLTWLDRNRKRREASWCHGKHQETGSCTCNADLHIHSVILGKWLPRAWVTLMETGPSYWISWSSFTGQVHCGVLTQGTGGIKRQETAGRCQVRTYLGVNVGLRRIVWRPQVWKWVDEKQRLQICWSSWLTFGYHCHLLIPNIKNKREMEPSSPTISSCIAEWESKSQMFPQHSSCTPSSRDWAEN